MTSHSPYLMRYLMPDQLYFGLPKHDGLAHFADIALLLLCGRVGSVDMREIAERPYDDGCHKNDAAHLLQVLLAFLPSMSANRFPSRETVGWKFHHKRRVFALD